MTDAQTQLALEIAARLRHSAASTDVPLDGDSIALAPDEEANLIVSEAVARNPGDPRPAALEFCTRRESGELLGHIVGRVSFLGCQMLTAPDCVIPRKETEILGRTAIDAIREHAEHDKVERLMAIDMCCGAGNLACAIAHHVPAVLMWAADLTTGCCNLARRNVAHLGLEGRVTVLQGDLFTPLADRNLEGQIDLVCCNPPYISSKRLDSDRAELLSREPREAFDGGPYGLSIHQRVLADATRFLHPKGWLMFEIGVGQERQFELLCKRTRGAYGAVQWKCDELGRPRVAAMQRT
jgi:release factor glutamine methyltransferase